MNMFKMKIYYQNWNNIFDTDGNRIGNFLSQVKRNVRVARILKLSLIDSRFVCIAMGMRTQSMADIIAFPGKFEIEYLMHCAN